MYNRLSVADEIERARTICQPHCCTTMVDGAYILLQSIGRSRVPIVSIRYELRSQLGLPHSASVLLMVIGRLSTNSSLVEVLLSSLGVSNLRLVACCV